MTESTPAAASDRLAQALSHGARLTDQALDQVLPQADGGEAARLHAAMRYSTFAGGKRLRPFLVLAAAQLFAVPEAQAARAAAAVEMIHTYSLIHDDLPCMDDDDLRRGQPTAHVQFDEATAVLAGDALLTQAFEVLADPATDPDPAVRADLVAAVARAAGPGGMVGGQMFDLVAETRQLDLARIIRLQGMKTGALISISCEMGAILGRAEPVERAALADYGRDLGLAFQIADDLLDALGSAAEMGKAVGKDAGQGKATFVSLLGVDGARQEADTIVNRGRRRLDLFGERALLLHEVAEFVVNRRN